MAKMPIRFWYFPITRNVFQKNLIQTPILFSSLIESHQKVTIERFSNHCIRNKYCNPSQPLHCFVFRRSGSTKPSGPMLLSCVSHNHRPKHTIYQTYSYSYKWCSQPDIAKCYTVITAVVALAVMLGNERKYCKRMKKYWEIIFTLTFWGRLYYADHKIRPLCLPEFNLFFNHTPVVLGFCNRCKYREIFCMCELEAMKKVFFVVVFFWLNGGVPQNTNTFSAKAASDWFWFSLSVFLFCQPLMRIQQCLNPTLMTAVKSDKITQAQYWWNRLGEFFWCWNLMLLLTKYTRGGRSTHILYSSSSKVKLWWK